MQQKLIPHASCAIFLTYINFDAIVLACESSIIGVKTSSLASDLCANCNFNDIILYASFHVKALFIHPTNNCHCKAVLTAKAIISLSNDSLIC